MPIFNSQPTRLRKFIPQPNRYVERYGNFTLTSRDLEILQTVLRYRYLEARHIRALVGGSEQQVTRRLQGLFHNKYLGRYARRERMRMELDPGAPLMAYGLELKGARALETNSSRSTMPGSVELETVRWRKAYTRRTEWFLEHRVMLSHFRCILELAVRNAPDVTLLQWNEGEATRSQVTIPSPRPRSIGLVPDAVFTIDVDGQQRHLFLEIDRATEEHSRLIRKYQAYWWYLQSADFSRQYPEPRRANVLLVTTGERRLLNMITTLREMRKPNRAEHGGKGIFWFCCHRDLSMVNPDSILTIKWHNAAMSQADLRLGFDAIYPKPTATNYAVN